MKTRRATVMEIVPNTKYVGHVKVIDDHGDTHFFNNGSLNGVKNTVTVGDKGTIEYQSSPSYGLWFWRTK
jgi:hypothetical protein